MNRGFKFLIQPTKDQQQKFINTFGCCRFVWNKILNDKQEAYKQGVKFNKTLVQYKTEFPFLKDADSLALNVTANHLNSAYKNFLRKEQNFQNLSLKSILSKHIQLIINQQVRLFAFRIIRLEYLKLVGLKLNCIDNYQKIVKLNI